MTSTRSRTASSARPPTELPADSVGFLLSKVGFDAARRFRARLAPLGLEPRQFALLRYVAAAEGQSQQALGAALEIPASRMVALIDDLEERGLVERRRNPADRRARALHLTSAGRRLLGKAIEVAIAHERELLSGLSKEERGQLAELLRRLAADQGIPIAVHPGLTLANPDAVSGWPRNG
jgi:DNA-binding MarR family transcriptional regulator